MHCGAYKISPRISKAALSVRRVVEGLDSFMFFAWKVTWLSRGSRVAETLWLCQNHRKTIRKPQENNRKTRGKMGKSYKKLRKP